jgi:hypothetical protein
MTMPSADSSNGLGLPLGVSADGEIRAAEVERVRDAAGDDVREDAGERILGPFRQLAEEFLGHVLEEHRQRGPQGVHQSMVAHATGGAEDAAGLLAVETALDEARVLEGAADDFQGKELQGVDRLEVRRRDAVFHRVEHDRLNEPTPLRVNFIPRLLVGIKVGRGIPALVRHLGNRVDFVEDVLPEGLEVTRLGENAAHDDNRDTAIPGLLGKWNVLLRHSACA